MPYFLPVIGAIVTALIAFSVYRYRNRISYSVISITADVPDGGQLTLATGARGRIKAERLRFKSIGLRNLDNIELHYQVSSKPISVEVVSTSSLSPSAVKTDWENNILKIIVTSLPSGEQVDIDVLRLGYSEGTLDRLKGTGGNYKVVRDEYRMIARNAITDVISTFMLLIIGFVWGTLS